MSALRRMFPVARRAASTAAAPAPAASQAAAPTPEAIPSVEELRARARKVYKELHRLGRDYPDTDYNFNMRLRRAFEKNAKVDDPVKLKQQLELAEHIKKEIVAMYSLRKYRHLRRAYHRDEPPRAISDHYASIEAAEQASRS